MLSTPIINPPQSAILGMHATNMRPYVVNGQIVPRWGRPPREWPPGQRQGHAAATPCHALEVECSARRPGCPRDAALPAVPALCAGPFTSLPPTHLLP